MKTKREDVCFVFSYSLFLYCLKESYNRYFSHEIFVLETSLYIFLYLYSALFIYFFF